MHRWCGLQLALEGHVPRYGSTSFFVKIGTQREREISISIGVCLALKCTKRAAGGFSTGRVVFMPSSASASNIGHFRLWSVLSIRYLLLFLPPVPNAEREGCRESTDKTSCWWQTGWEGSEGGVDAHNSVCIHIRGMRGVHSNEGQVEPAAHVRFHFGKFARRPLPTKVKEQGVENWLSD